MVLVKVVAINFPSSSAKALTLPAPLRAKKARKFALKTVRRALLLATLVALLIVRLPRAAAEFVKSRRAAVFVADHDLTAQMKRARIGHEQIAVIQIAPMRRR